ncbi:putative Farnesylcysteine lyase [Glarea lozoyensis 74030]|uniref:Putative Farnesylcysteine lyase n=1 Tax=Glarea lozoyensis (strain ATCC 74030 / MF5533) TaxID=1104152 RepID=H0EI91_GLAL7|nr:putative Farnesylcysteine lyase [Glarea lozoyensis 74030]
MKDSGWQWWDNTKLLWKYGMAPIKTVRLMKVVVGKFKQLYTAPFFPFRSLSDRAEDLDLLPATGVTGEQYLEKNGNLGVIHGLETMVCMAIEGAMSVRGGNWQIFDGMLKSSNATINLNTTVDAISKVNGASASTTKHYDTVILAAPFQYSGINVEEGVLRKTPDKIPYVTLHVTLFASNRTFSPKFFGLGPDADVPTTIITTLPPGEVPARPEDGVGKAGFFSMSTLRSVINPVTLQTENLYKVFSPAPVTPEFLAKVFDAESK